MTAPMGSEPDPGETDPTAPRPQYDQTEAEAVRAARSRFPRGLYQPPGCDRFSTDPLLLAAFAAPPTGSRVVDLGAGVGPAGLALLLRLPEAGLSVTAIDRDPELVDAARENARRLGLGGRFAGLSADLADVRGHTDMAPESFAYALANPPYRAMGSGREPPAPGRLAARFEALGTMGTFIAAAAYALKNQGRLALVGPAERLAEMMALLRERRLEPKRLVAVHPLPDRPARRALVEARKNGRPGLRIEPPLVMYRDAPGPRRPTEAALAFCPWLAERGTTNGEA